MDELIVIFMGVPFIIFMIFVAPLWLFFHYRSKRALSEGLSEQERQILDNLIQREEQMSDRIKTLEAILDAESPSWRDRA
ncbi:envelope stress response membrane protein PspB [Agaribacter flavus]|uniref:Envelope stress response membrane protein PspB n=1 Tax=Agaribacter flavus TaxID=1902781 RepID=A0ABV7FJ96_9ALTE